jgi:hypothetical protein
VGEYFHQMKGMADSLRDLGKPIADRTLVLDILRGLSPRYGRLKALIKRIVPFPAFYDVRNELLLEELTLETEAPAPAPPLYSARRGGQAPSGGGGAGPTPSNHGGHYLHSTRRPCDPSSGFQHRWRSSFPQGQQRERWLHPGWSLRSGWRPGVAVILQTLDRDHRLVVGPGPECLLPSYTSPPDRASPWRAPDDSDFAPAPASGDPHSSPPHPSHLYSTVVGNGSTSTLLVTSVGASVLPGPFYLNDVLVAPHITYNLLSVRRFTTDNSCSIEFDPFGFFVKDLATRTPLVRCDSSGPLYTLRPFPPARPPHPSWSPPPPPPLGIVVSAIQDLTS